MRLGTTFALCGSVAFFLALTAGPCWPASPRQSPEQSNSAAQKDDRRPQSKEPERTSEEQQNLDPVDSDGFASSPPGLKGLAQTFLTDQKQIWTSPAHLRFSDAQWLVPFSGLTAAFLSTDATFSRHLSNAPSTISHYDNISNVGIGALVGGAGGMWLLGHVKHNSHWTETGFLAGEAALSSLTTTYALKYSFGRARPFQDNGNGSFFQGGTSFPSEHASAAWSIAGIIAHEYPGPLTKIAAYSLATLVDFSRVRAHQHFPSDVLVGSALGNLIAQDIYSRRHDPELGGDSWRSVSSVFHDFAASAPSVPASPFVPLDSWVYPAIEQLAAQGYIDSAFLGSRPWTRIECVHLLQEAGDRIGPIESASSGAERLYENLYEEFHADIEALANGGENTATLESLYTRSTQIVGQPLNDSYHFGQTVINNFGRPYQRGFNSDEGFSAWAADGRFTIYVRGEYQHAPAASAFSQPVQNLITSLDQIPSQTALPVLQTNQFELLDTYVSTAIGGWNFSFGKQSLWWGQADGGALIFSDNAAPIYMFRASRTLPIVLPSIFRHLGAIKVDAFVGKLSGNAFPARPILHGEKISFKPTKNLELAFTRLAEMGGAPVPGVGAVPSPGDLCPYGLGRPITAAALFHSYFSPNESNIYACNANPGKRTAGFEFSYRLPFLRNWLTLYSDSLSPDDVSPISAPRRAAVNPGLYLSHFPKLSRLDLHLEAVNTNTPSSSGRGQFVYFDTFYHDLSTNDGNLIGSWIGREGVGLQAWSTYTFSRRTSLQLAYRHAQVASDFIPRGENANDASAQLTFWIMRDVNVVISEQYEKWNAPILSPTPQTNWTSTIGISYHPPHISLPFHASAGANDSNSQVSRAPEDGRP